jgi:hypothetical protein
MALIVPWRYYDDVWLQHLPSHRCGPTGQTPLPVRVTLSSGAVVRKSAGYFKILRYKRTEIATPGSSSAKLHVQYEARERI